jgi:hypothetical protein
VRSRQQRDREDGLEEFNLDPNQAEARDSGTVENYEQ